MRKIAKYLFAIVLCFFCFTAFIACGELEIDSATIKEGTMDLTIEQGESLDTSNAKLVIKYKDGTTKEVPANELEFDKSDVNTNEVGKHTLKVKYNGKEFEVKITVTQKISVVTLVNKGGVIILTQNSNISTSGIQLSATYNNGTTGDIANSNVTFDLTSVNTAQLGVQSLKVTYQGADYYLPVMVMQDDSIQGVSIKEGTLDLSIFKNESVVTTNTVLILSLKNGTTREVPTNELTFDTSEVDTAVAGSYTMTITYDGVAYPFTVTVADIVVVGAHLDPTSANLQLNQGDTLDLSGAKLILEYSDGSESAPITLTNTNFDLSGINTLSAGNQTLKVIYDSHEYDITVIINPINVTAFSSNVMTWHEQNTAEKVDKDKQLEFIERDNAYIVGDDNAMDWQIEAAGITANGQFIEDLKNVETNITIQKFVGGSTEWQTLDSEGKIDTIDYIDSIDRFNQLVDFSENAVGSKFKVKIELVHYSEGLFNAQNPPYIEHEIEIVDGYNVYNAYGLSLYDNVNVSSEGDYVGLTGTETWSDLRERWEDAGLVEEGFSKLNPNSIVLHSNIEVTKDVIPNKNFYVKTDDNAALIAEKEAKTNLSVDGSLIDDRGYLQGIYSRALEDEDNFNVYGNYFLIDASKLTRSVIDDDGNGIIDTENNQNESYITMHSSLFRAAGATYNEQNKTWTLHKEKSNTQGSMIFKDLYLLGNAARDPDAIYSGGIIMFKASGCNFTAENTIHKDFYIGYFTEYGRDFTMIDIADDTTLSADQVTEITNAIGVKNIETLSITTGTKLTADLKTKINAIIAQEGNLANNNHFNFINNKANNNYNAFFYVWGSPNIYIEGGEFVSCGGPCVVADHAESGYFNWTQNDSLTNYGANGSPSYIDAVNVNFESKVYGTEPWFNTYNVTSTLTKIKEADAIFNAIGRSFLTTSTSSNVPDFINFVFLYKWGAKELADSGAITRGSFRQFNSVADYEAYYSTGKLADGSNYYGFEANGIVSLTSKGSAKYSGEMGRFEASGNGASVALVESPSATATPATIVPSPTNAMDYNYGNGAYANLYLCNGFGGVIQLYNYTAPED